MLTKRSNLSTQSCLVNVPSLLFLLSFMQWYLNHFFYLFLPHCFPCLIVLSFLPLLFYFFKVYRCKNMEENIFHPILIHRKHFFLLMQTHLKFLLVLGNSIFHLLTDTFSSFQSLKVDPSTSCKLTDLRRYFLTWSFNDHGRPS